MCCGAPKYNPRAANKAASVPSPNKALSKAAPSPQVAGRKITFKRAPMGPQKLLPKHGAPTKMTDK